MVFGGTNRERIQFNEETLWAGAPNDYQRPGASRYLEEIRSLLFEGRQREAMSLASATFMSSPLGQRSYQNFGDLNFVFPTIDSTAVTGYRRDLDIDRAVARTQFQHGGVTYTREVFASQ
jgi:alpha-L-fucosidase 2